MHLCEFLCCGGTFIRQLLKNCGIPGCKLIAGGKGTLEPEFYKIENQYFRGF